MRILIVEDMPVVANRIKRLTEKHFSERVDRIFVAHSLDDAKSQIKQNNLDLLLLDLNLNGEDGFDLLNLSETESFQTIIITANKEEAIRAFDFAVFDFISKPINEERFELAIRRFLDSPKLRKKQKRFLSIRSGNSLDLIEVETILYAKAAGHYCELYTSETEFVLFDNTIDKFIKQVPIRFMRVHKSYAVQSNLIRSYQSFSGGKHELTLPNEIKIPVGRTYYKDVKAQIE